MLKEQYLRQLRLIGTLDCLQVNYSKQSHNILKSTTTHLKKEVERVAMCNVSWQRSGRNIKLYHNLGHTDYYASGTINAGGAALENFRIYANYVEIDIAGSYSEGHNVQILIIGQNK